MSTLDPKLVALRTIVDAAIAHRPSAETHIVANHLAQIEDLILGQGIDFVAELDPYGDRGPFIRQFLEQTHLLQYLSDIIRRVMGTGEVLMWLRYTTAGYRLRYYPKDDFVPYYDPLTDDLYAAVIVSHYTEAIQSGLRQRWLKIVVLREGTFVERSDFRPQIQGLGGLGEWSPLNPIPLQDDRPHPDLGDVTWSPSPLGQLPIVVLKNKATGPGQRSADDFSEFASQLVSHDRTMRAVGRNVRKFSRNTIFTNLDRGKIMRRPGDDELRRSPGQYGDSGTRALGYRSPYETPITEDEDEVLDVIGVDAMQGESFVTPIEWNSISTDQLQYLDLIEDKLHWSLGSVSKRGGGTAYEVRANLAWGTATANKKALNIFDMGICRLISLAIAHEEQLYEMSGGTAGLMPAGGSYTVRWRRIELVQPSPQDQLQLSILGRNLEEEGVGTREILRLLFPSKTDKEIAAMTGGSGGIPFRKLDKAMPQLVSLYQTALQLPPELGASLLPLASLLIQNLTEAINYGRDELSPSYPNGRSGTSGPDLAAILSRAIASASASSDGQQPGMDGMGSTDSGADVSVPAPSASNINPITAAFGSLTDWERSPIARALGISRSAR